MRHKNYLKLPESVGNVGYIPKEICKRVPPNKVKTIKEMLRVPKPKDDSKPRIRVENARIDP